MRLLQRATTRTLDAMEAIAIVLHGPTSAGKSAIAKALQATAPVPAFHVSLDAFVTMSNRRDMRSDEERQQAYHIHCETLRSTLARVVSTQFDIILDLVLRDETELEATLRVLAGRPTYVVGVSAPLDVLEERERAREDRATGMAREQVADPAYARSYDLAIDTSTCSAEEAAAAIRSFIQEQRRLTGQCSGQPAAAADFQR
jgi:chloramphenicol 3-O phosphotransferase